MPKQTMEFWTAGVGMPKTVVKQAQRAESEGWDGLGLVDSQNLAGDPFIGLALAASVTSTLKLATAVTNPLTRHPAALATAIATVQAESDGRAILGIGRGDSALAHLGLSPAPVSMFTRYLERLQGYLRGEDVPFDVAHDGGGEIRPAEALDMADAPKASRIRWLRSSQPKVPVDVAATGPKVIATAARHAERVTFAVGANVERLQWGIDAARSAAAGLATPQFGAYVPVLVHPDRAVARAAIAGGVASFARFSVMHGTVAGPADENTRKTLAAVHAAYDMHSHFTHGSPQSKVLTDDVIDTFGIAGPVGYCIDRLQELAALGITKIFVMGGGFTSDHEASALARRQLVAEVLPALK